MNTLDSIFNVMLNLDPKKTNTNYSFAKVKDILQSFAMLGFFSSNMRKTHPIFLLIPPKKKKHEYSLRSRGTSLLPHLEQVDLPLINRRLQWLQSLQQIMNDIYTDGWKILTLHEFNADTL